MISFIEKFNRYSPDDRAREVLSYIDEYSVKVDRENRMIEAHAHFTELVRKEELYRIERAISEAYELCRMRILPSYDPSFFSLSYLPEVFLESVNVGAVANGFFNDYTAKGSVRDGITIEIPFVRGGIDMLEEANTARIVSGIIKSEFSLDVEVRIEQRGDYLDVLERHRVEGEARLAAEYEEARREAARAMRAEEEANAAAEAAYTTPLVGEEVLERDPGTGSVTYGGLTLDVSSPEVFFGDGVDAGALAPLSELKRTMPRITVAGQIFEVNSKETRSYDKLNITVGITDNRLSTYVKTTRPKEEGEALLKSLKVGTCVIVEGAVKDEDTQSFRQKKQPAEGETERRDPFPRIEYSIRLRSAAKVKRVIRKDTAAKKRVELHLHTTMSQMDALIVPEEALRRAKYWGHPAVAITDHGNVQAFPDAMLELDAMRKAGDGDFKVIYGMEAYFVDDEARAVWGEVGCGFNGEFVVFDLETTGLSSSNDKIIEIGAVILRGGEPAETFSAYVNPGRHIPEEITKLTGISDETVADARPISEVLPEFFAFCGDRPLIAHNANFDTGFVRVAASELKLGFGNAYIDTLAMSRYVNPELKNHKLDTLVDHYGLGGFEHHRAFEDARVTALVFMKMAHRLEEEGVRDVPEMVRMMSEHADPLVLPTYHQIILVKNQTGLKNLYKLVSYSYLNYYRRHPRIPKTVLEAHREGLIIGSACEAGELYRAILDSKPESELERIAGFYDYLEIQPLTNNAFLIESEKVRDFEELKDINRRIVELGHKLGKPVVATCDAHFLDKDDEIYRQILQKGMKFADADRETKLYLRTTDEMLEEFSYLGEDAAYEVVVENTNLIADMIGEVRPIPKGTYTPNIEGSEEELTQLCQKRAEDWYCFEGKIPEVVTERLDRELSSIIKNGYAVLYIIAQKLVSYSESQGYLVGSRGSVGSSIVASFAGISEVNPLPPHYRCPKCRYSEFHKDEYASGFDMPDKDCPHCGTKMIVDGHDIPFETFLGFYGDKSPDIDLNFSGDIQGKVHKYTEELFGAENVFRAGTLGTVASKTAYGFVMKYLEEKGVSLTRADVERYCVRCSGIKRSTGQHPGGIIVVPSEYEVYDFTPVQHPADDADSDIITTHFAFSYLHDTILKLDELGHDIPTKYKMLERYTGTSVMDVPMNDRAVYSLLTSSKALGINKEHDEPGTYGLPELGTRFVMQMLTDCQPKTFGDLLQISGLSHGTGVWLGNAQELIKDGICDISTVIGCRDDIMLRLIRYGLDSSLSFKIMEKVRKGKGVDPEYEAEMIAKGVPDWYIASCKKIKYMFPKAHAAAYVMSAIRLGWYKINYPVEFYAAYFTAAPDGFDGELVLRGPAAVRALIDEYSDKGADTSQKEETQLAAMQIVNEYFQRGFRFLPVDIHKSDATAFLPEDGKIRLPFMCLSGVGGSAAESLAAARDSFGGQVFSIEELREEAHVTKSVIDTLRRNGVLDDIDESNQLSLFSM